MSIHNLYCRIVTGQAGNSLSGTSAIILAAGRGRRLSPLTDTTPKPLLPVLNLPLLLWKTARLLHIGIQEVYANVQYLPEAFREAVEICASYGPRLHLVAEPYPTGPLGGVISCREHLMKSETCLVMSGDALDNIDLQRLISTHRESGAELTMTVAYAHDATRYGVLDIDSYGFVTRMREKPKNVRRLELVSCGIYVISTGILAQLTILHGGVLDFVDLVSRMIADGRPIATYITDNWIDVGTSRDLLNANLAYLNSAHLHAMASLTLKSPTGELWMQNISEPTVDRAALVEGRVLLGTGITIERDVVLSNVVVGAGAIIRAGAKVMNSLLLPTAEVCAKQHIVNQVIQ